MRNRISQRIMEMDDVYWDGKIALHLDRITLRNGNRIWIGKVNRC